MTKSRDCIFEMDTRHRAPGRREDFDGGARYIFGIGLRRDTAADTRKG